MPRIKSIAAGTAGLLALAIPAYGAVTHTTKGFDRELELSPKRTSVYVHGPYRCTKGAVAFYKITITQKHRVARGFPIHKCTGKVEEWSGVVRLPRGLHFVPGPARACGSYALRSRGKVRLRDSWCRAGGVILVAR
jgi:hypothetical protein